MDAYRTAAQVLALLADRKGKALPSLREGRQQLYRQAAAVLASFDDLAGLQPVGGGGTPDEARQALATDLIPATGKKFKGKLMLHPDVRREAIIQLPTTEARQRALDANPNERTGSLQKQLEKYLLNEATPLESQLADQLDETLQIVTWLTGALNELPSVADVQARLSFQSFIAPLESLAGDNIFRGRRKELDEIRSYIGVLEPVALLRRIRNRAFPWTKPDARRALSISGPGGVGKSALVARFMLEHLRIRDDVRLPFAYLDFDRSVLDVAQPGTLLSEMLNQLNLQFEQEGYFSKIHKFFVEEMGSGERKDAKDPAQYEERVFSVIADLVGLIEHYLGPRPFVIVLDTFEEVQYRGERHAFPFWEMLDRMQQARPFLRVIVSGRAPVESLRLAGQPPLNIELGDLDAEAAVAYRKGLGIENKELAEAVVKQVGGVPLSLKLAATVVKRDGITAMEDVAGKSTFWFSASDEVIQGVLYSRILGHLHDPTLERIANPGLVLRRISAPVILKVLNEPCELGISTLEEAQELFRKLRDETSLVTSDTLDGSLVHRPDLRRTMLKLLVDKMPDRAKRIHQAAVLYYSGESGWRSKAEELYHRLQLGELATDKDLENPDVRSSLQNSISELPPIAQRHLATRGYQVAPEVLAEASQEEQEEALAAEIEEMLPYGDRSTLAALGELQESFKADHAGPLFCSFARVHAQLERFDEAAELIRLGLEKAFQAKHSREALALLSEQAWLLRGHPQFGDLEAMLPVFEEYARRHDAVPKILQHRIQLYELWLHRKATKEIQPKNLLREIDSLLQGLTAYEAWDVFPLFEEVFAALSPDSQLLFFRLVHDDEGPFLKAQFGWSGDTTQEALYRVINADPTNPAAIEASVADLCKSWPYRVLGVKPPYSRASYASEVSST